MKPRQRKRYDVPLEIERDKGVRRAIRRHFLVGTINLGRNSLTDIMCLKTLTKNN